MRIEIRSAHATRKIRNVLLLVVVMTAMSKPGGDVALGQNSTRTEAQASLFINALVPQLTYKGLGVYEVGPVQFILADPLGRRTGFDPISNTFFHDIPVSDYSTTVHEDEQTGSTLGPPTQSLVMANQMDGQYTLDVIGTGSGDFIIYVSASDAAGNDITHSYFGTTAPGVTSRFTFPGEVNIFAAFGTTLKINSASKAFEVNGTFTLGQNAAISPMTQPVSIQMGQAYLVTIPAGSTIQTSQGVFDFKGTIRGIALEAHVMVTGSNRYAFAIKGAGEAKTTVLPHANPVDVHLAIGSSGGSTSVDASFVR